MPTAPSTAPPTEPPSEPLDNPAIADILFRMAELLELEGANPFRARAWRRAATTIRNLPFEAAARVAAGETLEGLPGVGDELDHRIAEICRTGRLAALAELEARLPPDLVTLSAVPGLGPKRLGLLRERLGVTSVEGLRAAARDGRLRAMGGFGPALADLLADGARAARRLGGRSA